MTSDEGRIVFFDIKYVATVRIDQYIALDLCRKINKTYNLITFILHSGYIARNYDDMFMKYLI